MRIVGLPISLWSPEILKRVGDESGSFITVDEQTKSMGELQWARILVKSRGEFRPSILEFEVEEEVYVVSLWWECWPVMRRKRRNEAGRHSSEVRGEETSRAGQRVKKEWVSVRLETLQPSDEGTDVQGAGSGQVEVSPDLSPTTRTWALTGKLHSSSPIAGPKETRRVGGPSLMSGSMDLKMKGVAASDFGLDAGPSNRMEDVGCYAKGPASTTARSANEGPNCSKGCSQQPDPGGKLREGPKSLAAQEETGFLLKCLASSYPPEPEPFVARESEDTRKFQGVVRLTETNRALEEESMRYGMGSGSWGKRALGDSHLNSFLFDRTSGWGRGEFYDHAGDLNEEGRVDNSMWITVYEACNERINGRKELGVTKSSSDKGRRMEGVSDTYDAQVERSELEGKWEESGLARFSQFLGFPTEGLEKEILNFLTKIRKRREKIHSKELLEKSKFERELKRLECSINYEGGMKQKGTVQGKGRQIVIVQ